jgi:hypothetical protein
VGEEEEVWRVLKKKKFLLKVFQLGKSWEEARKNAAIVASVKQVHPIVVNGESIGGT